MPASALEACRIRSDDGTVGGYLAALEAALARCAAEIEARVE